MTAVSPEVELRCNVNPSRLLAKIRDPREGAQITDGNLVEIACDWCKQTARMRGRPVKVVVHRWNVLGELIETEEIR